ncbi:hypothetical protein E2C01_059740 [Portunus trituberculatus]|uniref:Uncharacterized protein n=1 Tax=Portunus trituberculatus TaxID=210409 RepID=A0A5B7H3F2_PORTR|nr:hypothetical protein [Portunus trituberculatus]
MNEGTLCTMHQTLAGRGSFWGDRAHFLTVVRVRKVVSSLSSHPRDWGGLLGRKSSSQDMCR